jgi:hypothetical protein
MQLPAFTLPLVPFLATAAIGLAAADTTVGIGPQLMIGTPGFEPGAAAEIHVGMWEPIVIRPELFISDDGRLGGGASLLWSLSDYFSLGDRQRISVGPRVVYHNSDEDGLEVSAFGVWDFLLGDGIAQHHHIEALGALGVVDDRDEGQGANLLASGGAAYIYRF